MRAAKYSGVCKCGAAVKPGDPIEYDLGIVGCPTCQTECAAAPTLEATQLDVRVTRLARRKPDGWSVVECLIENAGTSAVPIDSGAVFPVTGVLPAVQCDDIMTVLGEWAQHAKFGWQFRATSGVRSIGGDIEALVTFLSRLTNIGKHRAIQIATMAGQDRGEVLRLLREEPQRLLEIDGINEDRLKLIIEEVDKSADVHDVLMWLADLELSEKVTAKVLDLYEGAAKEVLLADPYCLREWLPLKDTDRKAITKLGVGEGDDIRLAHIAASYIHREERKGHTYLDLEDIEQYRKSLWEDFTLTVEDLRRGFEVLDSGEYEDDDRFPLVRLEGNRAARQVTHTAEEDTATRLCELAAANVDTLVIPADVFEGLTPHPIQLEAVQTFARSSVMVLTGGPGTGKTTIVRACVNTLGSQRSLLCAPTGKAAARMHDQTGRSAATIHRTLGWDGERPIYGSSSPLPVDAIIIDEFSMVDTHLVADLFNAIQTGTRVLIVGDTDQLPSVGPGAVLHDLIESGRVPVVRLTEIYRQARSHCPTHGTECPGAGCPDFVQGSAIPHAARAINEGRIPDLIGAPDILFLPQDNEDVLQEWVVHYVSQELPKQGIPHTDIQVLTPQKSRGAGTEPLNRRLQAAFNPPVDGSLEMDVYAGAGYSIRTGDRVIQTSNNYDLEVFNGEQGIVIAADPSGVDMALFQKAATPRGWDGKIVAVVAYDNGTRWLGYHNKNVRGLQLSYAITVHRAQGSQFPVVVMPVHSSHWYMLTRQLVYTALTRTERYLLLIGQPRSLAKSAANTRESHRRTRLLEFLADVEVKPVVSSLTALQPVSTHDCS